MKAALRTLPARSQILGEKVGWCASKQSFGILPPSLFSKLPMAGCVPTI